MHSSEMATAGQIFNSWSFNSLNLSKSGSPARRGHLRWMTSCRLGFAATPKRQKFLKSYENVMYITLLFGGCLHGFGDLPTRKSTSSSSKHSHTSIRKHLAVPVDRLSTGTHIHFGSWSQQPTASTPLWSDHKIITFHSLVSGQKPNFHGFWKVD